MSKELVSENDAFYADSVSFAVILDKAHKSRLDCAQSARAGL